MNTSFIADLHAGQSPAGEFNSDWWLRSGQALGQSCDAKLADSISYNVIDGEAWVWNHDNGTVFKVNPSGTRVLFDYLADRPISEEDREFLLESFGGLVHSLAGPGEAAPEVNNEDSHFAFRYLRTLAMERNIPLFPALELSYLCNYDCRHCYRPQERPDHMSLSRWKALAVELKAMGSIGLVLTGGEVTAWKPIREFIEFIRSMRMAFVFKTNGHLVDAEWAQFLVDNHCHEVHISLYGTDRQTNDYVTRRDGSFDRIVNAIRLCVGAGLKVRISSSLTEKTFPEYQKIIDLATDFGVGLNIDPLLSPSASSRIDVKQIRVTHEQVRHFCDGLGDSLAPEFRTLRSPGAPVCSAARSNCSIAPTGNVYPCVGYWYKENTLSVLNAPFSQVWKESPILGTVRGITNGSLTRCSGCKVREFCPRCLGAGYEETGELYGISPNNCMVAEGVHANYQARRPSVTRVGVEGSFGNRCS